MSEQQNLSDSPVAASIAEKFGKSENPAPPPTLGQRRVRRNFNPSSNFAVEDLKDIQARFIDYLEALRGRAEELPAADKGEYQRLIDRAQTAAEEASMWAVKAVTI